MTNFDLLRQLGFDTFLSLYEYLKKNGHHCQEKVNLIPVKRLPAVTDETNAPKGPDMSAQIEVDIVAIKALAFEEIHDALPFSKSVDVLRDLVSESQLVPGDQSMFINFLTKIPTRSV